MELEKKPKRPRIGAIPSISQSENGETDNRYEKVNYPNDEHPTEGVQRSYGDRQGYQQRQYGNYQQRQGGYNRYTNHYDRSGYQQTADSDSEKTEGQESSFQNGGEGGYQPRQAGYQPRQSGYQQRNNYTRNNQGGYNNQNRQGGYNNRNNQGYNRNNQGGYNRNNQGGYNNQNRQGSYNNQGYNRNNQGGYNNQNRQGGYNNRNNQGGYNNQNRQGGYNNRNNQGYNRNNQGGYNNRNNYNQNGFRKQNNNMKFTPRPKQIDYVLEDIDPNEQIRLNKYMANAGICSRREADEYITQGLVKVNGEVVTELGTKITRDDVVEYDDKVVTPERKCYVLLNKPKDCVTTSDDPNGRLTVLDLVKNACRERIYPVGRLDRNTTGVLLLTNDGDLASKLTHPKFVKKKIYQVWTDKDITEEDMQRLADGIELEDGEIHADAISYVSETDRNQAGIEIHSGRNRIVRRMFEHLGYRVIKLDRVYFAGLTKKNLPRGRWRYLSQEEVNFLRMGSFE
ncbi:MAG: rRNA pseudouridine synthase [Bacteroides sp.]|nr:rRNA pseudouridine synthase [Bacteroides sp.]